MSLDSHRGRVVHYPTNPDRFEFDDEVASVFDDMATRSICMYWEQHRLHSEFALSYTERKPFLDEDFTQKQQLRVLDVGCSTGNFLHEFCNQFQKTRTTHCINAMAVDPSEAMCVKTKAKAPYALVLQAGIENLSPEVHGKFHIINMSYVYQFLPTEERNRCLRILSSMCHPGGLVFTSHKFSVEGPGHVPDTYADLYNQFRLNNGYTQKEIDAKTHALKASMATECDWDFINRVLDHDLIPTPLTRWLHFGSYVCVRQLP